MGHAFVLNATYEPLCVVPARRALLLVLMRKAVAVEDSDLVLEDGAIFVRGTPSRYDGNTTQSASAIGPR